MNFGGARMQTFIEEIMDQLNLIIKMLTAILKLQKEMSKRMNEHLFPSKYVVDGYKPPKKLSKS